MRNLSLLILTVALVESMTSPALCQGMEESIDYRSDNEPKATPQIPPATSEPQPSMTPQPSAGFTYPTPFQQLPPAYVQPGQAAPPVGSFAPSNGSSLNIAPKAGGPTPLQGYASQVESTTQPPPQGLFPGSYQAPLQGSANLNVQQFVPPFQPPPMMSQPIARPDLIPQSAQTAPPQSNRPPGLFGSALKTLLSGGTNKNVPPAERPWWIPGHAYTNDAMVAPYHNMDIFWWDKRAMPDKPQWVRLAGDVTRYWNGYVVEPCFVYVEPFKPAPGNFVFHSRQSGGPRGWLQAVNQPDSTGFPLYRYWLDQPR